MHLKFEPVLMGGRGRGGLTTWKRRRKISTKILGGHMPAPYLTLVLLGHLREPASIHFLPLPAQKPLLAVTTDWILSRLSVNHS